MGSVLTHALAGSGMLSTSATWSPYLLAAGPTPKGVQLMPPLVVNLPMMTESGLLPPMVLRWAQTVTMTSGLAGSYAMLGVLEKSWKPRLVPLSRLIEYDCTSKWL